LAEYVELLWKRYHLITSVPVLSRTLKALLNRTGLKPSGHGVASRPN
jgi:hypothetical protein